MPTGEDAAGVEAVNVLDRQSQGAVGFRGRWLENVQHLRDGRPVEPRHRVVDGARGDVGALPRRNRDETVRRHPEAGEKRAVFRFDLLEYALVVTDEVHLVDDNGDLLQT